MKKDWILIDEVEITNMGGACPYQADGKVDGYPLYFRSRGMTWSMEVLLDKDGGVYEGWNKDCITWNYWERYVTDIPDDKYAAGYIEKEEAVEFINKAAKMFLAKMEEFNSKQQ